MRGRVRLDGSDAKLAARVTIPGDLGRVIEEALRQRSTRERTSWAQRFLARNHFPGCRVQRVDFVGLEDGRDPLELDVGLQRAGVLRPTGDGGFLLAPLLTPHFFGRVFGGKPRREHALVFGSWLVTDWDLEIDPGSLRWSAIPSGLVLRGAIFDYGPGYERRDGSLHGHRRALLRPGRIEPEDYSDFLAKTRRIDDAESELLRLRAGGGR